MFPLQTVRRNLILPACFVSLFSMIQRLSGGVILLFHGKRIIFSRPLLFFSFLRLFFSLPAIWSIFHLRKLAKIALSQSGRNLSRGSELSCFVLSKFISCQLWVILKIPEISLFIHPAHCSVLLLFFCIMVKWSSGAREENGDDLNGRPVNIARVRREELFLSFFSYLCFSHFQAENFHFEVCLSSVCAPPSPLSDWVLTVLTELE